MKLIFFGDIVGKSGRIAVEQNIGIIKEKYLPDILIY